ncbi:M18 family aminopeptidase [Jonesia quinghaiensis]|uniref:M18 family aminopeptidase n=1 Tax=Jonesia quinghaiensis TaxID=262806 RepID=UPI0003FAEBA0|nr:M18 family aminopeptidase [Jonesia quinghaiensis]
MDTAEYMSGFAQFITASPSSYHAAHEVARQLSDAGFTQLHEHEPWVAPKRAFVIRDGAIIAWITPDNVSTTAPVRVLGSHTDSPGFKLKPQSTTGSAGWLQVGVEVYGGPLLNSWLDRELELAGRLVLKDGSEHLVRTGPFMRVPQLAIHLDREANNGLKLDKQRHTAPVYGVGAVGDADVLGYLAELAGVEPGEVAGYDVISVDTQEPRRFGRGDELFAAGRMDNLSSVYAGLVALLNAPDDAKHISVLAAFDHEEIGSETRSGASGPFLADVIDRIYEGLGSTREERHRAIAQSWCLSSDAGHSVHPNYAERHDPAVQPLAGSGPLLKINANQRYATDGQGAAMWVRACEAAGIEYQDFVSNNNSPCGSTIGPLTATRLGIRTVDVGIPLLSMHSARELCHVADAHALTRAISAFYAGA